MIYLTKKLVIPGLLLFILLSVPNLIPTSAQLPDGTEIPGCVGVNQGDSFTFNIKQTNTFTNGTSLLLSNYNETLTVVETPYTATGRIIQANVTSNRSDIPPYITHIQLRSATDEFVWVNSWDDYYSHFKTLTQEEVDRNSTSTIWQVGENSNTFTVTEVNWEYSTYTASSGNMTGFISSNYNKTNGVLIYQTVEYYYHKSWLYSQITIKELISTDQSNPVIQCQDFPVSSTSSSSNAVFPSLGLVVVSMIVLKRKHR